MLVCNESDRDFVSLERGLTSVGSFITIIFTNFLKGEKQMNKAINAKCASPNIDWHSVNWQKVNQNVKKMQIRIVKATQEGKQGKVKSLQWLLTHSFSGKAIAVKKVTENQGKKTSGTDGIVWNTPESKSNAILILKTHGYKAKALKRVYIPKSNGKKRPLGIPTMRDRAMQALFKLALEPVAETKADYNSYGFRPERSTADAIEQCFNVLARKLRAKWIWRVTLKAVSTISTTIGYWKIFI